MIEPYDPSCEKFARDMEHLDYYWAESPEELELPPEERAERRAGYARSDGTYNSTNGHFLCDSCYIKYGMPSSPDGWVCP